MKAGVLVSGLSVFVVSLLVTSCGGSSDVAGPLGEQGLGDDRVEELTEIPLDDIRIHEVPVHQKSEFMEYYEEEEEHRTPFGQVYIASLIDEGADQDSYLHVDDDGKVSAYTRISVAESRETCFRRAKGLEPNSLLHGGTFEAHPARLDSESDYDFPVQNMKRDYKLTVSGTGYRGKGALSAQVDRQYARFMKIDDPSELDIHVTLSQDEFGYLASISIESDLFQGVDGVAQLDDIVEIEEQPARFVLRLEQASVNGAEILSRRCSEGYSDAHSFPQGDRLAAEEGSPAYSIVMNYDIAVDVFGNLDAQPPEWLYVYNLKLIEDENAEGDTGAAGSDGGTPTCYAPSGQIEMRYNAWSDYHFAISEPNPEDGGHVGLLKLDRNVESTLGSTEESSPVWLRYFNQDEEGEYQQAGWNYGDFVTPGNMFVPVEDISEAAQELTVSRLWSEDYEELLGMRCSAALR